ncbi:MAG: quinone-dependent dihydroorotate dehydrogenase [Luteibaculaceae bacterium]
MFKFFIRPILFLFPPEKAHYITLTLLRLIFKVPFFKSTFRSYYRVEHDDLRRKLFGLTFPNPVGLAAGFDKNAENIDLLENCGFGFIEIGTVTPKAQPGNEKPRLFRLPKNKALINRLGFNNAGVEEAIYRLKETKTNTIIIGGNIGKNKITDNENALSDYMTCFEQLHSFVHYFVVNVSSPNTPNLRALQEKEPLKNILNALVERNQKMPKQKPILLKIAPDLTEGQLDDIIEIVLETKIDGVVATNTTIGRENLKYSSAQLEKIGAGGLSGKPLTDKSTAVIKYLHVKSNGTIPIIGVGGIHSAKDALEKLEAGACLVQLYTGFIYEGPQLIKDINKAVLKQKVAL